MTILWWHWLILGLLLLLGELLTPGGFYILFFGIAAILTGVLALAGIENTAVQMLLFTVLSVGGLLVFRARVLRWMQADPQAPPVDTLVGEIGTTVVTLPRGAVGRVELRGTSWSARNISTEDLAAGTRYRVTAVDGLLLLVEPEGSRS